MLPTIAMLSSGKASSGSLRRLISAVSREFGWAASCLMATLSFWGLNGSTPAADS